MSQAFSPEDLDNMKPSELWALHFSLAGFRAQDIKRIAEGLPGFSYEQPWQFQIDPDKGPVWLLGAKPVFLSDLKLQPYTLLVRAVPAENCTWHDVDEDYAGDQTRGPREWIYQKPGWNLNHACERALDEWHWEHAIGNLDALEITVTETLESAKRRATVSS